jgi:hypothetical protein
MLSRGAILGGSANLPSFPAKRVWLRGGAPTAMMSRATNGHLAAGTSPPHLRLMLTLEGAALIAEVLAAAWLIVSLLGFGFRRTAPWLLCAAAAFIMLMTTVIVLVDATSS